MTTTELVNKVLSDNHIPYKTLNVDAKSISVDDHVKALGIKYKEGLSTLFFKAKDKYFAVLRRDDRNLDNKKLRDAAGVKPSFCSVEDLAKLNIEPGLASHFVLKHLQENLNVEVLVDNAVTEMTKVICGNGIAMQALEIQKDDLLNNIGNYKIVDITVPNLNRQDIN